MDRPISARGRGGSALELRERLCSPSSLVKLPWGCTGGAVMRGRGASAWCYPGTARGPVCAVRWKGGCRDLLCIHVRATMITLP